MKNNTGSPQGQESSRERFKSVQRAYSRWTKRKLVPPHPERHEKAVLERCAPLSVICPKCQAGVGQWCCEARSLGRAA